MTALGYAKVAVILVACITAAVDAFAADDTVCSNIRLSATEQFECRYRLQNALGPGDADRIQRNYDNHVRAETNRRVSPPAPLPSLPALPEFNPGLPDTPKGVSAKTGSLQPLPALPEFKPGLPDTPKGVPAKTGALHLPDTPKSVPENGGVLHLPQTPSGVPLIDRSNDQ